MTAMGTDNTPSTDTTRRTIESLLDTDIIGEAINTARELHTMALEAGNTEAAELIKVQEIQVTDPLTGDSLGYKFRVIAANCTPRLGRIIFANGELTPDA